MYRTRPGTRTRRPSGTAPHRALVGVLVATATLVQACGARLATGDAETASTASAAVRSTVVRVRNDTPRSQVVYLVTAETEIMLGTVLSLASRTFHLPPSHVDESREYRLAARAHGAATGLRSEPFTLQSGRTAVWELGPSKVLSVVVW